MKDQKLANIFFYISALLIVSGALLKISNYTNASYIFLAGACILTFSRVLFFVQNRDKMKGRLPQIQIFSSALLVLSGYFMYVGSNSWSVFIFLFALIELYVTFRGNNFQQKT